MQKKKIPACPYCGGIKVYRHGKNRQRRMRFRCKYCKKTFCNRTGTVRLHSHISDSKWKESIRLFAMRSGISGSDLARFLGMERKAGQRINRKLRKQTAMLPVPKLEGVAEADETTMTRRWVWGCVSRDKKQVILKKVRKRDENTLLPLIIKYTTGKTHILTDEWSGYRNLWNHRFHMTVNHSKEFVCSVFKRVHTNTQEGVWGLVKPLAINTYRGIPAKHLDSYLKEFMFRYNLKDYNHRVQALISYTSLNFHTLWV